MLVAARQVLQEKLWFLSKEGYKHDLFAVSRLGTGKQMFLLVSNLLYCHY